MTEPNDGAENCDCWKTGPLCAGCAAYEAELRRRSEQIVAELSSPAGIERMARDFDAIYPEGPYSVGTGAKIVRRVEGLMSDRERDYHEALAPTKRHPSTVGGPAGDQYANLGPSDFLKFVKRIVSVKPLK